MDSFYYPVDGYKIYEHTTNCSEKAHIQDFHEIFMLLEGNAEYFVEGTIFPLAPKELAVISAGTPHKKDILSKPCVKCFVIFITRDFFVKNNCPEYEKVFLNSKSTERKINADVCKYSGFFNAYLKLKEYTNDFKNTTNAISKAMLIEMLHILNNNVNFSTSYISNTQIPRILDFINANLSSRITLDDIADAAFLSKYHICKLFKKYVGYTVNQYINIKRIEKVKELVGRGKNITSACVEAGFSDYSAFYKAFLRTNNASPREIIKIKE